MEKRNNEKIERLFNVTTLQDSIEVLDIYTKCLFRIIQQHINISSQADADAAMMAQMMLIKILSLKKIVDGVCFEDSGSTLNPIVDPTIVVCLVRNIYETVGLFNHIYGNNRRIDEKTILYLLWRSSGLKYRQRFKVKTKNSQEIQAKENLEIEDIANIIKQTSLYNSLDKVEKDKIIQCLKDKKYLIELEKNKVSFLSWQNLTEGMKIKNELFDDIYTYFSLYTHPSNIAVETFSFAFEKDSEDFRRLTVSNVRYVFFLTSIFIDEYIKLFPQILNTFNNLDINDQTIIGFYNRVARRNNFSII